jgi:hypothetical protein
MSWFLGPADRRLGQKLYTKVAMEAKDEMSRFVNFAYLV